MLKMSTSQGCFVANQDPERDQGVIQQAVKVHEKNGVELIAVLLLIEAQGAFHQNLPAAL
jgi:hypothetical protein